MRAPSLVVAALCLVPLTARAQSLAERVAAVGDGEAVFTYAARPEVCGDGERTMRIGRSYLSYDSYGYSGDVRQPCVYGPARVRLTVRGGEVQSVQLFVGTPRSREGRALGTVPAGEAARYLLGLATRTRGKVGARAITAAVLADSAVVWPALLAIARNASAPRDPARAEAMLWLARFAGAAVAGHPGSLDEDEGDERDDVKRQAVFVLSQLPNREGVEPLLNVARTAREVSVRQHALFWLSQSGDPRALELFESLLKS